ncbi:MAG: hypothetical protein ACXVA7_03670 [Isosphaeraceae bacterium]
MTVRLPGEGICGKAASLSFVMDEDHLLTAARYMELNPVRAGSVQAPSRYRWRSSAVAHLRGRGLSRRRFYGGFHAYLLLLIAGDHSPIARAQQNR